MKYKLMDETKTTKYGVVLRRICALRDIPRCSVRKDDLGGWVENESNLSQDGDAWLSENAEVYDDAQVSGNARVSGNAVVCGSAEVSGDAVVRSPADYAVFKNTWSSYRWFTYTRSNKMWKVGCFYGAGDDLIEKAYADSDKSGRCYEAIVRAVESIESATAKEGGEK